MSALRRSYMKTFKLWLANKMFSYLFPITGLDKVVTVNKQGFLYLNGNLLTPEQRSTLKAEVRLFRNTQVWDILSSSLKYQGQKLAFNDSKELQDLLNAKMILYTVSVQENILKKIENSK